MPDTHSKPKPLFPIYVTEHARRRAWQRFPGFKAARIIDEVREAIAAGRFSASPPSGVTYWRQSPRVLYAWNDERCYPLKMMPGDDNGFFVPTIVPRDS